MKSRQDLEYLLGLTVDFSRNKIMYIQSSIFISYVFKYCNSHVLCKTKIKFHSSIKIQSAALPKRSSISVLVKMQYKKCLGGGAGAKASTVQRLACTVVANYRHTRVLREQISRDSGACDCFNMFHHCLICK